MIGAQTKVFPFFWSQGRRIWLTAVENQRNRRGELFLRPSMDDDPAKAVGYIYEVFLLMRRRFHDELPEQYGDLRATLSPGDSTQEIDGGVGAAPAPDYDDRVVQFIKGLIVRPGRDARGLAWFIKIFGEGNVQIDSIRAETPEAAVQSVFDRNLQDHAEKAPEQTPPAEIVSQPSTPPGPRMRPGSF